MADMGMGRPGLPEFARLKAISNKDDLLTSALYAGIQARLQDLHEQGWYLTHRPWIVSGFRDPAEWVEKSRTHENSTTLGFPRPGRDMDAGPKRTGSPPVIPGKTLAQSLQDPVDLP